MNYVLVIKANGTKVRYPATPDKVIPAEPGDEIVLVDVNGAPVEANLTPEEEDLVVGFEDGTKITIEDFYQLDGDQEPVTIGIKPPVENNFEEYEFNSQIGNLPGDGDFTLMRFSNTAFIGFDAPSNAFSDFGVLGTFRPPGGLGFGGGGAAADSTLQQAPQPVATPDAVLTSENSPVAINLMANDSGPNGGSITLFAIQGIAVSTGDSITLSSGAVVSVNADGTVLYTPGDAFDSLAVGESTTESFDYTIADADGNLADSTATVSLFGVNDGPEAVNDFAQGLEDVPIFNIPILNNDSDPDGDVISIVGTPTATNGTVTVNPDGTITYVPDPNFNGTDVITYIIEDPFGETSSATVDISIGAVNDAPVAIDDSGSGNEDTDITGNVITNDTDVDGDTPLTVVSNTTPAHGTLVILPNGDYTYTPDANYNGVDSFTYTMQDPSGATDTATVTLTVNPVNDDPTAVDDTYSVAEDSGVAITAVNGVIDTNDTDLDGDSLMVTTFRTGPEGGMGMSGMLGGPLSGAFGTLKLLADGSFDYTADQPAANALAVGESAVDTFTYTISDGAGGSDTAQINVVVTGTDDLSVITVGAGDSDTGAVTEDVDTDAGTAGIQLEQSGTLTVTDADTSDIAAFDPTETTLKSTTHTAQLGDLSIDAAGTWDYVVNNANVQFLDTGETITEIYTVEAIDGTTHDITIVINGADDPSEITVGSGDSDTGAVTEDFDTDPGAVGVQLEQSGTLTVTDADTSDTAAFDPSETVLKSTTHTAQLGTLSIDAAGAWDYAVNNANVQFLDAGETITEVYTVEATDGTTHDITITINGTDDLSEITVGAGDSDTGAVTEDVDTDMMTAGVQLEQSGTLTVTDADTSDTAAFDPAQTVLKSTTHTAQLGALTIDATGAWDYAVDNTNVQFLDAGETITEVYTVEAIDGTTHDITITINGADDLSEITVGAGDSDTGAVTEDVDTNVGSSGIQLEQSGTLTVTDADTSDTAAFDPTQTVLKSTTHTGQLGTLSIDAAGAWDYSVDNTNVQFLDAGETITEVYTVEAIDGTTHDITITINGADDLSEITVGAGDSDMGVVTEDVDTDAGTVGIQLEQSGTLTVTDADTSDTAAFDPSETVLKSTTHTAQLGSLSINAAGAWDYAVNNTAVQFLDAGETITEVYTVEATDGTTHDITIVINGADDLSQITLGAGDSDTGAVTEDVDTDMVTAGVQLEQSGTLTVTDADTSDIAAFDPAETILKSTTHTAQLGALTIDAAGAWDYAVDNTNVQFLDAGETITEIYTVEAIDGTTHDITIVINGADDPSEITVGSGDSDTGAVTEDFDTDPGAVGVQLEQSGTLTVTDADTSDTAAFDPSETVLKSTTHTAQLGTLTIDAAGAWDYAVNNANVQFLDAGETITEIYTVEATDGTTHDITITINGTDDLSEITVGAGDSDMGAVTEDVDTDAGTVGIQLEQSGTLTVTDADTSDTAAFDPTETILKSTTHTAQLGTLAIDAAGAWDYAVDNTNVQFLDAGESITEVYTVEATDGTTHDITITINGADDLSEITVGAGDSDVGAVTEDVDTNVGSSGIQLEQSGTLTVTDADTSDTAAFDPTQTVLKSTTHTGQLGTLSIDAAGTWDYSVDNTNVQFLDAGETITEVYTVESTDGTTHDITITINGADDLSEITVGAGDSDMGVVTEDVDTDAGTVGIQLEQSGTLTVTDADTSDTAAFDPAQTVLSSTTHTGPLGSLIIDAAGAWDYAVNNTAVQFLDAGETITEIYTVEATDGTTHDITITINGADDLSEITVGAGDSDTGAVTEDIDTDAGTAGIQLEQSGTLTVTDADTSDTAAFDPTETILKSTTHTAQLGALTIDAAGAWDYAVDNTNVQFLDAGETITEIYTVEAIDGTTHDITIVINGADDPSEITVGSGDSDMGAVTEDFDTDPGAVGVQLEQSGTLTVTDADTSDTAAFDPSETVLKSTTHTAQLGTLSIDAAGAWDYAVNNANVQFLDAGETITEIYTVEAVDGTTHDITIVINGADDLSEITVGAGDTDTGAVTEDVDTDMVTAGVQLEQSGTLTVTDADTSDTAAFDPAQTVLKSTTHTAQLGALTIDATGAWDYAVDNTNVQFLDAGESITEVYTVEATDGTTHDITITINGADDLSEITVGAGDSDTGAVTEDVDTNVGSSGIQLEQSGTLTVTDADTSDTAAFDPTQTVLKSTTHTGQLGTLSIDAAGAWDYSVDNTNVQFLDAGETITEVYTVEAIDGTTHDITITINGADDLSEITVGAGDSDMGAVTEDVDTDAGTVGIQLEQSGTLTVTDADTSDTAAFDPAQTVLSSTTHTGPLGSLIIDAAGAWDYAVNNTAVQFLDAGETITEVYTVEATDGTTHDITIVINGADDLSQITLGAGDSDTGAVTEDIDTDAGTAGIQLEQSGTLTVTDADTSDTAAFDPAETILKSTTHTAQLGALTIDAAGAWDYAVNNTAVQFLDAGETITEIYTVEAIDGTTHDITIVINGADDPSEITVGSGDSDTGAVTEDFDTDPGAVGVQLEQSGTLTVTDADTSDTAAFDPSETVLKSTTHTAQLGTLSIDAAGAWDYSVDNANVQFLDAGETITEIYTVEATDGTTHDITITINGTDDLSEITVGAGDSDTDTGAVTEDVDTDMMTAGVQLEQSGTLTVTDADTSDMAAFDPVETVLSSTTHTGQLGMLSIDAAGAWDYSVDNANVQFLDAGETITEVYTVEAIDGTTHDITITINGADDLSEITVGAGDSDVGAVTEDVDTNVGSSGIQLEQSGTLTVTDADTSDTAAFDPTQTSLLSTTHTAQLGTLSINAAGAWDYAVDNASVQFLDTGETVTEVYTVEATDGTTHDITITINGADDLSEITVGAGDSDVGAVTEDVDTDMVTAGVQLEQSGTLTVTDADTSDTAAFDPMQTSLLSTTHTAQLGVLSINAAGAWDYAVDNASVQFLDTGETVTEVYTVEATDGTTHDITITINGADDLSEINVGAGDSDTGAVTEDVDTDGGTAGIQLEQSGTLTVTDADTSDTAAFDPTETVLKSTTHTGQLGNLSINAAGAWDYSVNNANVQFLDAGETVTEIYTVETTDGTTHDITIVINGADDLSEVTVSAGDSDTGAVTEDFDTDAGTAGIQLEQSGTLTVTDADTSDTAAFDSTQTTLLSTTHTAQLGTLSINSAGAWDYTVDNANVQFLDAGETITEVYTVETVDGTTHDITITINGTDDLSEITVGAGDSDMGMVTEDVDTDVGTAGIQLEQSGTLTVTDADTSDTAAFDPMQTVLSSTTHTGQLGTLSINAAGAWDYAVDNANVQFLDAGETITEVYTVEAIDGTTHDITIVINGAEDVSEITVGAGDSDMGAVTEDVDTDAGTAGIQLEESGTLTVIDPDTSDTSAFDPMQTVIKSTTHTGQLGSLSINAAGAWDFAVDNANVQFLDAGESITEVYTVETIDGTTHDITVVINGADDPSEITVGAGDSDLGAVTEDVDTDAGTVGIQLEQSGTLTVTDADTSDTAAFDPTETVLKSTTHTAQLGALSIDAAGAWDYAVDNANVQFLDTGETVTEVYTVEAIDGTTHDITITINGADDISEITVGAGDSDMGAVTEDVDTDAGTAGIQLEQTGTLTVTDADTSDAAEFDPAQTVLKSTTHTAQLGTLSINAAGTWDFSVDNVNVQFLDAGESVTEIYTVETIDGTTHDITIVINGAEDASEVNVGAGDSDTGAVTEDVDTDGGTAGVQLEQSGTLTATDADTSDTAAFNPTQTVLKSTTHTGQLGNLSIDAAGAWDYAVDNANVQFLKVGETITEVYTVETTDGTTHDITIVINGANEAPVATDDVFISTTDIDPITINALTNDTDADGTLNAATLDLDTAMAGIQTTVSVAGEGTWTTDGSGNVTFTPIVGINTQPSDIDYAITDNNGATSEATIKLRYSAADVWFGNDESGSVSDADFDQSRTLISGAANQMNFATGDLAFNAALFTWSNTNEQLVEPGLELTSDKTAFVSGSSNYSRNFVGRDTNIGQGIVFGTQQIVASVAARALANDPRAGIPQVMVILTDAHKDQILDDTSLLADAQAAKDAGIILVFVAIQEAQQDATAVARLEQAASLDSNGDPLVVTALSYADIDSAEIADLLNAIREAAAAGLLPPVVIDLDGDGAEFTTREDGVQFDADGDGVKEQIAWAGKDDALLVYDKNDDGDITDTDEISFTGYLEGAETDLEGLRAFDTDDDGLLSTEDAEWERFHLWQDANGDGIVDEGELTSLDEGGIESIGLFSDEVSYDAADGDVHVHGESVVTYADGTTGTAADSEFKYSELVDDSGEAPLEIINESGDVVNLDEPGAEAPLIAAPDAPGGDLVVPEGSPVSSIDEQAANDAAMS